MSMENRNTNERRRGRGRRAVVAGLVAVSALAGCGAGENGPVEVQEDRKISMGDYDHINTAARGSALQALDDMGYQAQATGTELDDIWRDKYGSTPVVEDRINDRRHSLDVSVEYSHTEDGEEQYLDMTRRVTYGQTPEDGSRFDERYYMFTNSSKEVDSNQDRVITDKELRDYLGDPDTKLEEGYISTTVYDSSGKQHTTLEGIVQMKQDKPFAPDEVTVQGYKKPSQTGEEEYPNGSVKSATGTQAIVNDMITKYESHTVELD